MEQEEQKLNSLPDNAYRELKPGEVYKPIMPANSKPREVTTYSVVFGIIMAIVLSPWRYFSLPPQLIWD